MNWLRRLLSDEVLVAENDQLRKQLKDAKEREILRWNSESNGFAARLALEQRVKDLEGEREIFLRAVTGIGPELLKRLAPSQVAED